MKIFNPDRASLTKLSLVGSTPNGQEINLNARDEKGRMVRIRLTCEEAGIIRSLLARYENFERE